MFKKITVSFAILISLIGASNSIAGEKLNQIFDPEMIGANLPYFERISGPAKNSDSFAKNELTNLYKIEGCEVNVKITGNKIQSIGLNKISSKCAFDLNKFLPNAGGGNLPPLTDLTFGKFDKLAGVGQYGADCLLACGNGTDPISYELWQASRADDGYQVKLGVRLNSEDGSNASDVWKNAMAKKESDDWLIETKFNCTNKYNNIAKKAFANVKITSITIGVGYSENICPQ